MEIDLDSAQNKVNTLRNQPPVTGAPDQQQWDQLVDTFARARQPTVFTPGQNPVLSTIGNDVMYMDYPPPAGSVDIKDFKAPESFKGNRAEADPFINRCLTYFAAKPNAMRLAKTWILYGCSIITECPASHWAQQVAASITRENPNKYYTDDWNEFASSFVKKFGIPNAQQHYFAQLMRFQQGQAL